jgi:hypothetical protein
MDHGALHIREVAMMPKSNRVDDLISAELAANQITRLAASD